MVVFRKPGLEEFEFQGDRRILPTCVISALTARKMLHKGCQAFLANVISLNSPDNLPHHVPVVNEFLDVFPEELPGSLRSVSLNFALMWCPVPPPYRYLRIGWRRRS